MSTLGLKPEVDTAKDIAARQDDRSVVVAQA